MVEKKEIEECAGLCLTCFATCQLATKGWASGIHRDDSELLLLLTDCALVCQTTSNFLLRGSAVGGLMCATCARICDRCASECEKHADLKECALHCRACSARCQQLAPVLPTAL